MTLSMRAGRAPALLFSLLVIAAACSGEDGDDPDQVAAGGPDAGDDGVPDDDSDPPAACGPDSCDGCCDGDVCRSGQTADGCGSAGDACQVCGPSFVCGAAAACEVDPASRWDLVADDADAFDDNAFGTAWDSGEGLPDPYVKLATTDAADDHEGRSDSDSDTLAPIWDQVVLEDVPARALAGSGFTATLLDDDGWGNADDSMGSCDFTVEATAFDEQEIEVVCQPDLDAGVRGWTLRWRLQRH